MFCKKNNWFWLFLIEIQYSVGTALYYANTFNSIPRESIMFLAPSALPLMTHMPEPGHTRVFSIAKSSRKNNKWHCNTTLVASSIIFVRNNSNLHAHMRVFISVKMKFTYVYLGSLVPLFFISWCLAYTPFKPVDMSNYRGSIRIIAGYAPADPGTRHTCVPMNVFMVANRDAVRQNCTIPTISPT